MDTTICGLRKQTNHIAFKNTKLDHGVCAVYAIRVCIIRSTNIKPVQIIYAEKCYEEYQKKIV